MSVIGINKKTGERITGTEHLAQSIRDILSTPIGTRVMRRNYGSNLFDLIDANITGLTLVQIYAATADALTRWEPRLRVTRVQAEQTPEQTKNGRITIALEGIYLPEGREIRMEGLVV